MPLSLPLAPYDRSNGFPGLMAPPDPFRWVANNLTSQRAYIARLPVPSRVMTITKIGFLLTTAAGANDNVDVGLYDASLNRLASSGATAGKLNATAGAQTVNLSASYTLLPGVVYYAALTSGTFGSTAAQLAFADHGAFTDAERLFGATAGLLTMQYAGGNATLPSSITADGGIDKTPILVARES